VIRFRRGRFADLVGRQLDLFEADEAAVLAEAHGAEAAWKRAGRDEAEEAFGDWQLIVDDVGERLLDLREAYAATLDDDAGAAYREAFNREAESRFREFTGLLR
jgi:hypothetical protein